MKHSILFTLEYVEFYNKNRGLPEPRWGTKMSDPGFPLQCPVCNSQDLYASASPDDPWEIFPSETIRCAHCGRISDWYSALKQRRYHPGEEVMEVLNTPRKSPGVEMERLRWLIRLWSFLVRHRLMYRWLHRRIMNRLYGEENYVEVR